MTLNYDKKKKTKYLVKFGILICLIVETFEGLKNNPA